MPGACSLHGRLFLAQQWQRAAFVQFGGLQTLLVRGVSPYGQALATTPAVAVTARPTRAVLPLPTAHHAWKHVPRHPNRSSFPSLAEPKAAATRCPVTSGAPCLSLGLNNSVAGFMGAELPNS